MIAPIRHAFTVDVEEYFQVSALERVAPVDRWDSYESRVVPATERLLALLESRGVLGTFFVLGWVAERHPELVRTIVAQGHELASHGYWHRRVTTQGREEFRDDIRRARTVLEDCGGVRVIGYRAPSFSIVPDTEWALDILLEEGYQYDSSRFPIQRAGYGSPDVAVSPHIVQRAAGRLAEFPLTIVRILGRNVPVAGGGWFRQFPLFITNLALERRASEGLPAMFYIHPWELDPGQPRFDVNLVTRIRHYNGIASTARRIDDMLARHAFGSIRDVYASFLSDRSSSPDHT